jgi:uncharacterized paraquat-inducible protein A
MDGDALGMMNWYGSFEKLVILPYWFLFLVAVLLPSWWAWKRFHLAGRRAEGYCPTCGYDLRASRDRCPECGTPIRVATTSSSS